MPEKTVFLYGHVLRAFFYAQTCAEEISCSSGARVARRVEEDKLPYSIFIGKTALPGNDVGMSTLFLHPELINNEIHCAYL